MSIAKEVSELFFEFKAKAEAFGAGVKALTAREQAFFGDNEPFYTAIHEGRFDVEGAVSKVAGGLFGRLIRQAEVEFAPQGGRLSIDELDVREACGLGGHRSEWSRDFNPEKVWAYLEKTYGGEAGQDEGYRQMAALLVYEFNLKNEKAVTVGPKGQTVLNLSVYLDSIDKSCGRNRIAYRCMETIGKVMEAMRGFASWANLPLVGSGLQSASRSLCDYHREVVSRATYGGGGVTIITYHARYEFRLDPSVAEQFQLFISLYGMGGMKAAA